MTGDLAARWAGTVVPSWFYRWLMPVVWLGAIVTSVAGTGRCSVDDPTVCGPDRTFSLAVTACLASLILLWWQPIVAAAAGLLFMVLDLAYDDVAGARISWTVYGVLCAALLLWTYRSRSSNGRSERRCPGRLCMFLRPNQSVSPDGSSWRPVWSS